jgi:hypothetical protein
MDKRKSKPCKEKLVLKHRAIERTRTTWMQPGQVWQAGCDLDASPPNISGFMFRLASFRTGKAFHELGN